MASGACVGMTMGEFSIIKEALKFFAENCPDMRLETRRDACRSAIDFQRDWAKFQEMRDLWRKEAQHENQ